MYNSTTLDNGIKILTYKNTYSNSVSVGFWINAGSIDEKDSESGFAHFIEHMMFKGTKKRNAFDIAKEIDKYGAYINAGTTKEYTSYYIKIDHNKIKNALDILIDMLSNSLFDKEELEKERRVVLEEIYMYEDSPTDVVHDNLLAAMYPSHQLGRPILGSIESVSSFNRKDILRFLRKHYTTDNLIISIAGKVNHKEVVDYIKKSNIFNNRRGIKSKKSRKLAKITRQDIIKTKDLSQVNFCLGFPAIKKNDERRYALYVINTLLGASMSSRLFQELREKSGLCYSIYSFTSLYRDSGILGIYAGTNLKNFPTAVEKIIYEIKKIKNNDISDEEIANVKEHLKGNIALSYDNNDTWMESMAKQSLFYNDYIHFKEIIKKVDRVTRKDVMELVNLLFPDNYKIIISSIGNKKHKKILSNLPLIIG